MNVWQRFWLWVERERLDKASQRFLTAYRRLMRSPAAVCVRGNYGKSRKGKRRV